MINSIEQAMTLLRDDIALLPDSLYLKMRDFCLEIRSNSQPFLDRLGHYFSHVKTDTCSADVLVEAYDTAVKELPLDWQDWAREPGKTGKKDAYIDLDSGRLLLKVRTGMLFLQSRQALIARGPCLELDNQVINFINSQYMNWLQHRGWLICHASGLDVAGQGIGMAGLSGGGKSTLMLGLMDHPDVRYVTNDRLFIKREADGVTATGIPKLPRINPGTIVHNPKLRVLLDAARRSELLAMPQQELWHLEEKHDVMIDEIYGDERIQESMQLTAFLVLNWSHDTDKDMQLTEVDISQRRDLLAAIMKSPGPFYQLSDGRCYQDHTPLQEPPYLETLVNVKILEAGGRVDIPRLQEKLYQWIKRQ